MPITLLTVNLLKIQGEAIVSSFASWSTGKGTTLVAGEATNLRVRGYGTNVASFGTDCASLMARDGYADLDADLRTDIETIAVMAAAVASTIATLIEPDAHFAALDSTRQSALVDEVVDAGIAVDWDGVPADLKADLLQHDVVDSATIAAIIDAVTIA